RGIGNREPHEARSGPDDPRTLGNDRAYARQQMRERQGINERQQHDDMVEHAHASTGSPTKRKVSIMTVTPTADRSCKRADVLNRATEASGASPRVIAAWRPCRATPYA